MDPTIQWLLEFNRYVDLIIYERENYVKTTLIPYNIEHEVLQHLNRNHMVIFYLDNIYCDSCRYLW